MRFCMVTTFYPPHNFGGDGIFVQRLCHELASRGHHIEVIHCTDSYRLLAQGDPQVGAATHPGVKVHALHSALGWLSPLATQQTGRPWFKAAKLREILTEPFDVIHYHNISLVGGPEILTYGTGRKLYTLHEYWLECPTSLLFRHNREVCEKRECTVCCLAHRRPPQWWRYSGLLERAIKHVDLFLAPSRFMQDRFRRFFQHPVEYLPNFISARDSSGGRPASDAGTMDITQPSPDRPYFLFVGRLEKAKGLQTLIGTFRSHPRADLVVAGVGGYESELHVMAEGSDRIRFLGLLSPDQLTTWYRNAVALIVPSLYYEVFPLVILEAFRERTPVLARNLGSLSEIIHESGGGLLYDTDQELRSHLDRLLSGNSTRETLGRGGYETYRRFWSPSPHLARYFELIQQVSPVA